MKISNDIGNIYGALNELKGEVKIDGEKPSMAVKSQESLEAEKGEAAGRNYVNSLPQELRQQLEGVFGKDIPLDRETIQVLRNYLEKFPGSIEDKIQVLMNLINKDLDINMTNLKLVHEALLGRDFSELIKNVESRLGSGSENKGTNNLDSLVGEIRSMLAKGAPLDKILDVMETKAESLDNDTEARITLMKAANEGRQASAYRMEDLAWRIINKALKELSEETIEEKPYKAEEKTQEIHLSQSDEFREGNEEKYLASLLAAVGLKGKDYLVTEITPRLREAAQSFKEIKRDIVNNLDMAARCIKESGASAAYNAKVNLQKTIDLLDKAILKSDIALFGDMKLEKELLKSDSMLQKAKTLLDKGDYDKAWDIVNKVKSSIEALNWKPSNSRIVHMASLKEELMESSNAEDKLRTAFKALNDNFKNQDYTPRKVYEAIRLLGGDHEGETARFLAGEKMDQEDLHNNIKSLLMRLTDKDGITSELAQKISGNQLLNKDSNGLLQSMFFALPLVINGKISDMKVYINSKKDEKKLDWQNCSIFFLIDTKKLGETGVLLQASGGNLNITVKNDRDDLKEKANPLLQGFRENLKELGYEIGSINFAALNAKDDSKAVNSNHLVSAGVSTVNPIKKGFDIRI